MLEIARIFGDTTIMPRLFKFPRLPGLPFLKRHDGSAVIEFAIVAPILFLLVAAFIEMSMIFFVSMVLEGATSISSRTGKTGYPFYQNSQSREDYIRQRVEELSVGTLNSSNLSIDILSYADFSNVGRPEPCSSPLGREGCGGVPGRDFTDINGNGVWDADQGRSDAGGSGEVVIYRTRYVWPILTPIMREAIGDGQGNIIIESAAAVRNERF